MALIQVPTLIELINAKTACLIFLLHTPINYCIKIHEVLRLLFFLSTNNFFFYELATHTSLAISISRSVAYVSIEQSLNPLFHKRSATLSQVENWFSCSISLIHDGPIHFFFSAKRPFSPNRSSFRRRDSNHSLSLSFPLDRPTNLSQLLFLKFPFLSFFFSRKTTFTA